MANEPPTNGALIVTFTFLFLMVQPATACNGWTFLKQNFKALDTGNDMIVVHDGTHLELGEDCVMTMKGAVDLEEMPRNISINYTLTVGNIHKSGKIEDICDRWDTLNSDKDTKEKYHALLECFLSFVEVEKCPIRKQTIHEGSCDLSEFKQYMKPKKSEIAVKMNMNIQSGGREAVMETFMLIGKST